MFIFILKLLLLLHSVQSAIQTPEQIQQNNETSIKPIYTIGVLMPNPAVVKANDSDLTNMIVTSELNIELAAQHIKDTNILPGISYATTLLKKKINKFIVSLIDVDLQFVRYYSEEYRIGKTSWTAVKMIEAGVK